MRKTLGLVVLAVATLAIYWAAGFGGGKEDGQRETSAPSSSKNLVTATSSPTNDQPSWILEAPDEQLTAGGRSFPVVFTDETRVSNELRNAIIYDLNVVYGHLPNVERLPQAQGTYQIGGVSKKPDGYVQFVGKGRFFPDEHLGQAGVLVEGSIVIPPKLVESYREAWQRKFANEAKYGRLMQTLEQLNDLGNNAPEDFGKWFYAHDSYDQEIVDEISASGDAMAKEFSRFQFKQPSLLDVVDGGAFDETLEGMLAAKIYVFDEEDVLMDSMPLLVYSNGAWRFRLPKYPT